MLLNSADSVWSKNRLNCSLVILPFVIRFFSANCDNDSRNFPVCEIRKYPLFNDNISNIALMGSLPNGSNSIFLLGSLNRSLNRRLLQIMVTGRRGSTTPRIFFNRSRFGEIDFSYAVGDV